jgi:hypothetical protein
MISGLILLVTALLTRFWLRPPPELRVIAWFNYLIFAFFSFVFSQMTGASVAGVDALKYFRRGAKHDLSTAESISQADFMYMISGAIQRNFPVDYLAFNLIGAMLFSYVGLLLLMQINQNPTSRTKLVWWIVTFLPGFHFWNASFGKDSLQLLLIGNYVYFRHLLPKGIALLVLMLVRPHIAIAIGLAEGMMSMIRRGDFFRKVLVLAGSIFVVWFAVGYLIERLGGATLSLGTIITLFSDYGDNWKEGSLRNSDTSTLLALPEFLLRPYFWEVITFTMLITSFDSLVMTVAGGYVMWIAFVRKKFTTEWFFAIFVLVLMAFTNPNPGTAARKKQLLVFAFMAVAITLNNRPQYILHAVSNDNTLSDNNHEKI